MKDISQIKGVVDNLQKASNYKSSELPKRDETQAEDAAWKLWETMIKMYSTWTRVNGAEPTELWISEIALLEDSQLRSAILKCREMIKAGDTWAPDYARFMSIASGMTQVDYFAAFNRCLSKKPTGRIEQWVYENASYNICRMGHDKAEIAHKKWMNEAIEKERRGELMLNAEILARALPEKVDRNLNDIKRQEFDGKKHKFSDRIAKLRKNHD